MSKATNQLWMMRSNVLNGFYMSHIIVLAPDVETATDKAVQKYADYIDERLKDYSCVTATIPSDNKGEPTDTISIYSFDEEEEIVALKERFCKAIREEALKKLCVIEDGALLLESS